jgi:hypothetical protein
MPTCDRLTSKAKHIQDVALREALQLGHSHIGPEHLLLAIVKDGDNAGADALNWVIGLAMATGKLPPVGLHAALRIRILDILKEGHHAGATSPEEAVHKAREADERRREHAEEARSETSPDYWGDAVRAAQAAYRAATTRRDEAENKAKKPENPLSPLLEPLITGSLVSALKIGAVEFLERVAAELKH